MSVLPLFRLLLEFAYTTFCQLPFMVVGAVSGAASGLLLSTQVNTQILYFVVGLIAIAMINTFIRFKRASQMHRHDEAMSHNRLAASLHLAVDGQKFHRHIARQEFRIPHIRGSARSKAQADAPFMGAVFDFLDCARAAQTEKVRPLHFFSYFRSRSNAFSFTFRAAHCNKNSGISFVFG